MARYIIPLIIVVVLLIYFFYPAGDDTAEIKAVLDDMIESAGKKDPDGITEYFSLHYKDEYGATYPVVKNIIKNALEKFDSFDVSYSDLSVSISENEDGGKVAAANLDVIVTGIKSGVPHSLIGSVGSPENVTLILKESALGKWEITEVQGLDAADEGY